jgi:cytoskeletal protein CcmA (bactofilin family)
MIKNKKDTSLQSSSSTLETSPSESSKNLTIISKLIRINGEIAGQENLTIQGRVEGTVELKENHVTVGKTGHLTGDLYGKLISVEGEVQGNLFAQEKIALLPSAVVHGDMQAPVISLQEGAKFKGRIDMDTGDVRQRSQFIPTPSPELKGV